MEREAHSQATSTSFRSGRDFSELVAPIRVEAFLAMYWQKRPVFIKGDPEKVGRLIAGGVSREDVYRGITAASQMKIEGFNLVAHRTAGFDGEDGEHPASRIDPQDAPRAVAEGSNIQASGLHDHRLAMLISRLKVQLGYPGKCYVSSTISPAGFGWPFHYDPLDTFVIQCEGKKRFRISDEPQFPFPFNSASFGSDGTFIEKADEAAPDWEERSDIDVTRFRDIVLEPGDVLYLPPGVVHGTKAIDPCLNLFLNFNAISPLDILTEDLRSRLIPREAWRHIPATAGEDTGGGLPPTAEAFFADRLSELRQVVAEMTPESLSAEWHRRVAYPGERVALGVAEGLPVVGKLDPKDVLCFNRSMPVTHCSAPSEERIHLFLGANEIVGEGDLYWFFRDLVERDRFVAEEAMAWGKESQPPSWSTVEERLSLLCEQGILSKVS